MSQETKLSLRAQRRADYLDKVKQCVCQDRNSAHGEAEDNFVTIAEFWSAFLNRRHGINIKVTALDVADMMVLFKVARSAANPLHADTRYDMGGYSACGAGIAAETEERAAASATSGIVGSLRMADIAMR